MTSQKRHLALVTYVFWAHAARINAGPWVLRVAADDNIADWLTRPTLMARLTDFWQFDEIREVGLPDVSDVLLLKHSAAELILNELV